MPTEHSSGQSRSQGSITKTGNSHARRLLVEAAWQHRKTYRNPGLTMRPRWELAPTPPGSAAMRATSGCTNAGKGSPPAAKARRRQRRVARELAGWAWSLAVME